MILSNFRLLVLAKPSFRKILKFGKTAFSSRYLLYTNIFVGGQLSAIGDVIQQKYQHSKPHNTESWDPKRTAVMLGSGACLTPIAHFWYLRLDKWIPGNSVRIALIKLIPDILVFSPIYILLFLFITGLMEGQSVDSLKKEVKDKSFGLLAVDICLWTPAQFVNFYFLPTRFRVLYDNFVSLIGDVLYSYFRYDYEVADSEDNVESWTSTRAVAVETVSFDNP